MIKVEPCKGCGGVILVDDFMGLRIRCEAAPVDAQTAGSALLAGQSLYRVHYLGGRPSSFGSASTAVLGALRSEPSERPMVVVQHRCKAEATGAPLRASEPVHVPEEPKCPKGRENAAQGAARGRSVEPVTRRRSNEPVCDGCGQPCADGTYASIALGDLIEWAHHVDSCP